MASPPALRDVAAEIVRRTGLQHGQTGIAIVLSDPPTAEERLELLAAELLGIPVLIMERECMTEEQWIARYCMNPAGH